MNAQKALEHWRQRGLLTEEKVRELEASLRNLEEDGPSRGIIIFASVGAVLVGLGILLFIGSNWRAMGPIPRGTLLLAIYAAIVAGAWGLQRRGYERLAEAVWFLATLSFGANIFFLGQIFNFTLTFWQGPLVWLIGVLAMGFARGKAIYGHVAMPLLLLFLGWLGGGAGWFTDDQFEFLWTGRGLLPLFPTIGAGLLGMALLLRCHTSWAFLERGTRAWGVLLVAVPFLVATIDGEVVEDMFEIAWTPKQWALVVASVLLVAAALVFAGLRSSLSRGVLAAVAALALALPFLGSAVDGLGWPFFLIVLVVFALALATVWLGLQASEPKLLNVGMASLAILILIQYFALSAHLFHGSLVFVFGGLVLMALAYFMERARRRLLSRMQDRSAQALREAES